MSTKMRVVARVFVVCLLLFTPPLSARSADRAGATTSPTLDAILSEYHGLKPKVVTLVDDIRQARKNGQTVESGKILLVRRDVSEFVKRLRRYDKDHLRAAKGVKTYPDREKILRLFHASDAIHRLIEAEAKSVDFLMLGLKYEDMWKQADTAMAGDQSVDR